MYCDICFEEIKELYYETACTCKFTYHKECITNWFKINYRKTCPVCKKIHSIEKTKMQIWKEDIIDNTFFPELFEKRNYYRYKYIHILAANEIPWFKTISILPEFIVTLEITNCGITELPYLPKKLKNLWCWKNSIKSIKEFPENLEKIDCSDNPLEELPEQLPDKMIEFYARNINTLILPKNLDKINIVIIGNT